MQRPLLIASAIASLLLSSGCQSLSTQQLELHSAECQPVPEPEAWFMQAREPNLTRRMLNELSASPMTETKD